MFAKPLALLSFVAAVVLANDDAHCKCMMRVTGWNLSGDSKTVCDAIKDAKYDAYTQECVIKGSNKYGAGLFDAICATHTGYTNCQQKEKQLQRRDTMEPRHSDNKDKKKGQSSHKGELANCQCTDTIFGHPDTKSTKWTCESIAGGKWDKHLESCRIDPTHDLQLEEFRRYCGLELKGSSC